MHFHWFYKGFLEVFLDMRNTKYPIRCNRFFASPKSPLGNIVNITVFSLIFDDFAQNGCISIVFIKVS